MRDIDVIDNDIDYTNTTKIGRKSTRPIATYVFASLSRLQLTNNFYFIFFFLPVDEVLVGLYEQSMRTIQMVDCAVNFWDLVFCSLLLSYMFIVSA